MSEGGKTVEEVLGEDLYNYALGLCEQRLLWQQILDNSVSSEGLINTLCIYALIADPAPNETPDNSDGYTKTVEAAAKIMFARNHGHLLNPVTPPTPYTPPS